MQDNSHLLRQVHPNFIQNGNVSSQAFRPTPKDQSKLSVYDGDMIDPARAWQHYTQEQELQSVGVMSVIKSECDELELQVEPGPAPFPEHVLIDFSGYGQSAIKTKAKLLRAKAQERGWLHEAG